VRIVLDSNRKHQIRILDDVDFDAEASSSDLVSYGPIKTSGDRIKVQLVRVFAANNPSQTLFASLPVILLQCPHN
jgi:hypothetical protein